MLRVLVLMTLALMFAPSAIAAPTVSVQIGPGGSAGDQGSYYTWTNATAPEEPRNGNDGDDCWNQKGRPPAGPAGAARGVVDPIVAWDPTHEARLSGWFPRCVSTEVGGEGASVGRVSYNVTSGRYYVNIPILSPLAPAGGTSQYSMATGMTLTGTTGVSMVTDCEGCPPPLTV